MYVSLYTKQKADFITTSFEYLYLAEFLDFLLHNPNNTINCRSKFDMGFTATAYNWKNVDGLHLPGNDIRQCWLVSKES